MAGIFAQDDHALRLDWGLSGAVNSHADLAIVVDVLSFSTTVSIAIDRGMVVHPYRWADESAEAFAREHGAVLAVGRGDAARSGDGAVSLSPAALLAGEPVPRLVLPSPNGSSICEMLRFLGGEVAIGCLRNASATAGHVQQALEAGRTVVVVAAGELWADGTLRPCLEDHLGAGAVLAALSAAGFGGRMSPEARAAVRLFAAHEADFGEAIRDSVSGRELVGRGFEADVVAAVDLDASAHVPVLVGGAFSLVD